MSHQPRRDRIFVVTATFPPDGAVGSLRTLRLLKHLSGSGSDVEVVTLSPDTYRAGTVVDPGLLSQIPAGVRVTRARALRPFERLGARFRDARGRRPGAERHPSDSGATREGGSALRARFRELPQACSAILALPDREASWILPAVVRGCASARRNGRPDVIYSSGPPFSAHVAAGCLASLLKKPWVADFRDPWARAPWREDRFGFEKRAWSILERLVVKRANAVVFVTEANKGDFARHYGEALARRFHLVPNGCDVTDFDGLAASPPSGRFVLLHAGSLYGARNPAPFFRVIAESVANGTLDRHRFRVRFIGRIGVAGVDLPGLIRAMGIEDVIEIVPHMPRRMVLQEMLDASALLVVQPVTRVSIPSKLYEYLAAARPILALAEPDGDTAALVSRSKSGIVVSPADADGIRGALAALIAAGADRCEIDRALYDGALRAAELGAILRRTIWGTDAGSAVTPAVSISSKP